MISYCCRASSSSRGTRASWASATHPSRTSPPTPSRPRQTLSRQAASRSCCRSAALTLSGPRRHSNYAHVASDPEKAGGMAELLPSMRGSALQAGDIPGIGANSESRCQTPSQLTKWRSCCRSAVLTLSGPPRHRSNDCVQTSPNPNPAGSMLELLPFESGVWRCKPRRCRSSDFAKGHKRPPDPKPAGEVAELLPFCGSTNASLHTVRSILWQHRTEAAATSQERQQKNVADLSSVRRGVVASGGSSQLTHC